MLSPPSRPSPSTSRLSHKPAKISPTGSSNVGCPKAADPRKAFYALSSTRGTIAARYLRSPQPWRRLASQYDCALVAASFAESSDSAKPWGRAMLGSGAALLRAIDQFSGEAGLPAMKSVPIVLAGVCEAGQFAHEFAAFAPVRTAAFVTIGGGKHNLEIANEAAGIPGLFVVCRDRGAYAVENMLTVFADGRQADAPWGITFESINAYDAGRSSSLVQAFLRSALASASSDRTDLRMKLADRDLHPADYDSQFPVSRKILSWLPRRRRSPFSGNRRPISHSSPRRCPRLLRLRREIFLRAT